MNKLYNEFDELQNVINDCQSDVTKFIEGNNSAGTRVRKAMQMIKKMAQDIRVEVQDQKNKQFYINKGSLTAPFFYTVKVFFSIF